MFANRTTQVAGYFTRLCVSTSSPSSVPRKASCRRPQKKGGEGTWTEKNWNRSWYQIQLCHKSTASKMSLGVTIFKSPSVRPHRDFRSCPSRSSLPDISFCLRVRQDYEILVLHAEMTSDSCALEVEFTGNHLLLQRRITHSTLWPGDRQ